MTTTVVNIHKLTDDQIRRFRAGDPSFVYIGRANAVLKLKASIWCNDHSIEKLCKDMKKVKQNISIHEARTRVIEMFKDDLMADPKLLARLPELVSKTLICYCKPAACHGDVLIDLLRERGLEK